MLTKSINRYENLIAIVIKQTMQAYLSGIYLHSLFRLSILFLHFNFICLSHQQTLHKQVFGNIQNSKDLWVPRVSMKNCRDYQSKPIE